jgi:hypothetical protein
VNFSDEELVAIRLREYVATHPEAQQKLARILAEGDRAAPPDSAEEPEGRR